MVAAWRLWWKGWRRRMIMFNVLVVWNEDDVECGSWNVPIEFTEVKLMESVNKRRTRRESDEGLKREERTFSHDVWDGRKTRRDIVTVDQSTTRTTRERERERFSFRAKRRRPNKNLLEMYMYMYISSSLQEKVGRSSVGWRHWLWRSSCWCYSWFFWGFCLWCCADLHHHHPYCGITISSSHDADRKQKEKFLSRTFFSGHEKDISWNLDLQSLFANFDVRRSLEKLIKVWLQIK